MMVEEFVNNVIIVDDKPEEIKDLEMELANNDISFQSYTPEGLKKRIFCKSKQLLFMDLLINDNQNDILGNISTMRKLLENIITKGVGIYGLVLWTKHIENINQVKQKISLDRLNNKYWTPSFIIGLDKTKYMREGSYHSVIDDLNTELKKDKAANFFINWSISVSKSKDKAISDIYKIIPEYEKQEEELSYLFYQLAKNQTGIPDDQISQYKGLSNDAYKAFDEMLYSDLINQQRDFGDELFEEIPQNPWNNDLNAEISKFAEINKKLFIDDVNISQNIVVPGNVYKINEDFTFQEKDAPVDFMPIAIEITPPCDFSNKKRFSRVVCGFLTDCPKGERKAIKAKMNSYEYRHFDYRYRLWPIMLGTNKFLCFDFRYLKTLDDEVLKDKSKYELTFRVTHKLFADILQKFSSHSARLGLSDIKPNL
jgi:hypothetical protein